MTLFSIACIQENICGDSTRQLISSLEDNKKFLVKDSPKGVTPTDEVNSLKMFIDKFLLNIKSNQIAGKLEQFDLNNYRDNIVDRAKKILIESNVSEMQIDHALLEDEAYKEDLIYKIGEVFKQTLLEFGIGEY